MSRHAKWISRTVFPIISKEAVTSMEVPAVETAYKEMTYRLNKENILQTTKRNRYYEKQWMKRRRLAFEQCKFIQQSEVKRKLNFVIRQNRKEPWRI